MLFLAAPARAELRREAPIPATNAAVSRQALIVTPISGHWGNDAEAYRGLLRRLGFEVATLTTDNRVDLEADLRRYPSSVRSGAEVVVMILGTTLAHDRQLFVTATAPSSDVIAKPTLYAAEGVRLQNALSAIAAAGARDVVAIVDACRAPDEACAHPDLPDGISATVAYRAMQEAPSDRPRAGVASLRDDSCR